MLILCAPPFYLKRSQNESNFSFPFLFRRPNWVLQKASKFYLIERKQFFFFAVHLDVMIVLKAQKCVFSSACRSHTRSIADKTNLISMITPFWKTLSSLKCVHSGVKFKVESWWLKQTLVLKKISCYSGKIRVRQLIVMYSSRQPRLPRTRWRVTWIKTDVVRFWRTFSRLYFEKAETCFFLAHNFHCLLVAQPLEVLTIRILLPAGRVRRKRWPF